MGTTNQTTGEHAHAPLTARRIEVRGTVQGVGFRPFVYRLAQELGLAGTVANTGQGVCIDVEGSAPTLEHFAHRLQHELPPLATLDSFRMHDAPPRGFGAFTILESDRAGAMASRVPPDVATCPDCLAEIYDPDNRRYRYPFTNCTNCGPRYSIITRMPYDRPYTTMAGFTMCAACRAEYENPRDRRFHAQPVACPDCGPQLALWDQDGAFRSDREAALSGAVAALKAGQVLALKGLGGFQLLVDGGNEEAVRLLRARKHREFKPFALMYPGLPALRVHTEISKPAAALLRSPQAPIVLLPARKETVGLATSIAPDTRFLGAMLPYTPLHHLLLKDFGGPLVVTSGNLDEEPICIDEREALERLASIAD